MFRSLITSRRRSLGAMGTAVVLGGLLTVPTVAEAVRKTKTVTGSFTGAVNGNPDAIEFTDRNGRGRDHRPQGEISLNDESNEAPDVTPAPFNRGRLRLARTESNDRRVRPPCIRTPR